MCNAYFTILNRNTPQTMEEICILNMKNPACSKVLDTKNVHCLSAEFNVFNLPMLLMFEQKYME